MYYTFIVKNNEKITDYLHLNIHKKFNVNLEYR